jgi:NADP-dependent 3-hydroxy acid dehydrogenase YdfG
MGSLDGKVAWVTGAGTGIGEGAAMALAREGARLTLTGRRREPLEKVAAAVRAAGGRATVAAGDLTDAATVKALADGIVAAEGRLDVVVSNAGVNIPDRQWRKLSIEGVQTLLQGNLASALYMVHACLPHMRRQKDGVLIHVASWAGRFVSPVSGPVYTAAKHGVVAMSHSINVEECTNGIRSTVICPAEVATPIMDQRSPPPPAEERARMLQPDDLGRLVAYVAAQPPTVCLNEILISPTWNRGYIAMHSRPT